nr:MAG TPA: hypothetical protein [Caudoviricetes sp.]
MTERYAFRLPYPYNQSLLFYKKRALRHQQNILGKIYIQRHLVQLLVNNLMTAHKQNNAPPYMLSCF